MMNMIHLLLRKKFVNTRSGKLSWGRLPLNMYNPADQNIFEVPVSVTPDMRMPMHSTYVFALGADFFDRALYLYLEKQLSINYLFHGIDMVDISRHNLSLPGFKPFKTRMDITEHIIKQLSKNYDLVRVDEMVQGER